MHNACIADAVDYLRKSDPSTWALAIQNRDGHLLNGHHTSNFAESENNKWRARRFLSPLACMHDVLRTVAVEQFDRMADAREWDAKRALIVPRIMSIYDEQLRLSREGYNVSQTSDNTAVVKSTQGSTQREREVNWQEKKCSCTYWQQRGIPCRHAIVFASRKRNYNFAASAEAWFRDMFWPVYRVSNVVATYNQEPIRVPVLAELPFDGVTLPAPKVKQRGAPRKRRIRSAGEGQGGRAGKPKQPRHCAVCGDATHNRPRRSRPQD